MEKTKGMIFLIAVTFMVLLSISGCGREKPRTGDDRLVAEVNNYKMTIGDFKGEARFVMISDAAAKDPALAKGEILDELITKKLLMQEAQAQNFDKDKAFMKEIERYWEQALLKLLYKKKSAELSRAIDVGDNEVLDEYKKLVSSGIVNPQAQPYESVYAELKSDIRNRKLQQAMGAWMDGLRSKSKIRKYEDNLKEADIK